MISHLNFRGIAMLSRPLSLFLLAVCFIQQVNAESSESTYFCVVEGATGLEPPSFDRGVNYDKPRFTVKWKPPSSDDKYGIHLEIRQDGMLYQPHTCESTHSDGKVKTRYFCDGAGTSVRFNPITLRGIRSYHWGYMDEDSLDKAVAIEVFYCEEF